MPNVTLGCPICKTPIVFTDNMLGVICPKCDQYLSKRNAVEVEVLPRERYGGVMDTARKDWHKYRDGYAKVAEDQANGKQVSGSEFRRSLPNRFGRRKGREG